MKISIVTGFFLPVPPIRGGSTEKIWHRLAEAFARAGHEITFLSRRWPGLPDREIAGGVTHIRLKGANHSRHLPVNVWHDMWWGFRVAQALPPGDVVICNTLTLPVWLRRVKPAAGRVVAVIARMPKGRTRVYGQVDLLLALSAAVSVELARENPRLVNRIAPFPYPIDWDLHARAEAKAVPPAPVTIGYVGRIHPEKGLSLLLAAAVRLTERHDLPPWRIQLTGPWTIPEGGAGEAYQEALQREFGDRLGARLSFAGPEFDPAKLAQRYGAMDVFCYPSLAEKGETFGLAVAEAMAAGCAPVVSQLACFEELIRDTDTGLTFDHAASDAADRLAAALGRLLTDVKLRRAMGARAQAHARRYDFAHVGQTLLENLERLVAGPARSQ